MGSFDLTFASSPLADLKEKKNFRMQPLSRFNPKATLSPTGYNPTQIRHAYGFDQISSTGTNQTIAIVIAYDNPYAAQDLKTFINQFGLTNMYGLPGSSKCTVIKGPHPCFQKVYAQNKKPKYQADWAMESSLDIQWAHAAAPGADIVLVEAKDNTSVNLFKAIDITAKHKAKVVSMSWGSYEFPRESYYDKYFKRNNTVFVAASGDSGYGASYPAIAPYVVSVGGTTLPLDSNGNLTASESGWTYSGGGLSDYISKPFFQNSFFNIILGNRHGNPDVSYNANSDTGVSIYNSNNYYGQFGWYEVGGTSAGAPQWAGIFALANQGRIRALSGYSLTSSPVYNAATGANYANNYNDIQSGFNGLCGANCNTKIGYDFVTGLGSPKVQNIVPYLRAN